MAWRQPTLEEPGLLRPTFSRSQAAVLVFDERQARQHSREPQRVGTKCRPQLRNSLVDVVTGSREIGSLERNAAESLMHRSRLRMSVPEDRRHRCEGLLVGVARFGEAAARLQRGAEVF